MKPSEILLNTILNVIVCKIYVEAVIIDKDRTTQSQINYHNQPHTDENRSLDMG